MVDFNNNKNYICEFCDTKIDDPRIEVVLQDGKLIYFHPLACKRFTKGTDCLIRYAEKQADEVNSMSIMVSESEEMTKAEVIAEINVHFTQ